MDVTVVVIGGGKSKLERENGNGRRVPKLASNRASHVKMMLTRPTEVTVRFSFQFS